MSLFSLYFILFLCILSVLYYTIMAEYQWGLLLAASMVFYILAGGPKAFAFLIVSSLITYFTTVKMQSYSDECDARMESADDREEKKEIRQQYQNKKRVWAAIGITASLIMLICVKYLGFLESIVAALSGLLGMNVSFQTIQLLLPLGISFYIFQSIGYIIDVSKGKAAAERNYLKALLFISYFPQMMQGPISRYKDLHGQLTGRHEFDYAQVKDGILLILWGYIKKMVIADRIAVLVNEIFANYQEKGYAGLILLVAVVLYGFQIYADFSGGIDIITGVSEMLGIRMPENFRQPFFATSVSDFWQRWHITLGSWMRDYVFYPLALSKPFTRLGKACKKLLGSQAGKVIAPSIASLIVFLIVGLWHGPDVKYVAFGMYQAFFVSTASLFDKFYAKVRNMFHITGNELSWRIFQILRTNFLITVGRYLSRAASLGSAVTMWKLTFSSLQLRQLLSREVLNHGLDVLNIVFMLFSIILLLAVDYAHELGFHFREWIARQDIVTRWFIYLTAIFFLIVFGVYGREINAESFIYQGF